MIKCGQAKNPRLRAAKAAKKAEDAKVAKAVKAAKATAAKGKGTAKKGKGPAKPSTPPCRKIPFLQPSPPASPVSSPMSSPVSSPESSPESSATNAAKAASRGSTMAKAFHLKSSQEPGSSSKLTYPMFRKVSLGLRTEPANTKKGKGKNTVKNDKGKKGLKRGSASVSDNSNDVQIVGNNVSMSASVSAQGSESPTVVTPSISAVAKPPSKFKNYFDLKAKNIKKEKIEKMDKK